VLLDSGRPGGAFSGGETLPPLAPALRHEMGLGQLLAGGGHRSCYGNAAAWGSPEPQHQFFIRSPYGHDWHLDRPVFDAGLQEQAMAAEAQVLAGPLARLQPSPDGWHLHVGTAAGELLVQAGWVLDCTGRQRVVSRQLGQHYCHDDRLVAYCQLHPQPNGVTDADCLTLGEAAS
jgi:hypothetical protein